MPNTTLDDAEKIVQRIVKGGSKYKSDKGILSVAFGWATKVDNTIEIEEVFKNADEYMY